MDWHEFVSMTAAIVGALAAVGVFSEIRRLLRTIERHDVQLELLWRETFGETPPPHRYHRSRKDTTS